MVPRRVTRRECRLALGTLAAVAAVAALVVKAVLFPHFSLNHDEAVYLQFADLLLEGHLRLYPPVPEAFRPWFFVDSGDSLYAKYPPVTPVLYAAAKLVTGSYAAALPVVAAGVTGVTGVVVAEAFDRRTGIVAAALVVASPLFLVQAGTFLPYAPTLLLELLFAACYLRGERLDDRRFAAAAGVFIGAAFFARPYTAVLFGAPFVAHAATRLVATHPDRGVRERHVLTAATGLVGVGAALGYNWVLTGDPLVFPYQAFAPLDGIGFGRRELLGYTRFYDLALALESNWIALRLYATHWVVGGLAGTLLAVGGVARVVRGFDRPRLPASYTPRQARALLLGVGVSVVVGNLYFWGTLNAVGDLSDPAGLATFLGPYYHFDLLVPTAAFAATAIVAGGDRLEAVARARLDAGAVRVALAIVAVLGIVVLGVVTVGAAGAIYERNAAVTDSYEAAYAPFEAAQLEDGVVLVPRVYGGWLNHPFQELRNDAGFDGDVVYALRETNTFAVVDAYPDRSVYRYVYRGVWNPAAGSTVESALRPVEDVSGERVTVGLGIGVPDGYESVSVVVSNGSRQATYAVDWAGSTAAVDLIITRDGARLTGADVTLVTGSAPIPVDAGDLEVRAFLDTGRGAGITYRFDIPVTVTGDSVRVLSPYAEVCADPRLCGGGGAALPDALSPGVFVETALNTSATTGG